MTSGPAISLAAAVFMLAAVATAQRVPVDRVAMEVPRPGLRLMAVPDSVILVAPANGATPVPDSVRFVWKAVSGAVTYELALSPSLPFNTRVDTAGIADTAVTLRNLPVGQTIYWRVRAADGSGSGAWSAVGTFTTARPPVVISDSVKPLTELGTGLYRGFPGGLYGNGEIAPPAEHLAAGLALARSVRPLDRSGAPDPSGAIVLLSIGMSNTTQEFSTFKQIGDTFAAKNPRVVIVDGAQGGQTASIIADTAAAFWTIIDQRLQTAGVARQQVQVVWLKEANAGPTTGFPRYAEDLERDLSTIVRQMALRYPNLKLIYLSSRIYGGYATTTLNPEMYAYEGGFSVKWLIDRQTSGDTALAFSGPARRAPWLAWGPYLWANGLHQRSDGLIWEQQDFVSDGTHPSPSGRLKVARMLLDFLASDTTARIWFLRPAPSGVAAANVAERLTVACAPNPVRSRAAITFTLPADADVRLLLVDGVGRGVGEIARGRYPRGTNVVNLDLAGLAGRGTSTVDAGFVSENPASGAYFCVIVAAGASAMVPVVLCR